MQFPNESFRVAEMRARGMAACTIVSRNYLSHARVLAESFLRHEPGSRFYLLVVDGLPEDVDAGPGITVVPQSELDLPSFYEMCFKYTVLELCTAVKPAFLTLLFSRHGEEFVTYFDPDIWVARPLDELWSALSQGTIVLTPHLLAPIPTDGRRPSEQDILISGAYNLGFVSLRKSPETDRFLWWWNDRLLTGCVVDTARGLFVDQKWVDLVPGIFPSTHILRDDTYNVAYWNLHSRELARSEETYLVNGKPLAFFHFSGFEPSQTSTLSKHQNRIKVERGSALADLLKAYSDLHYQREYSVTSKYEYGYGKFSNGIRVNSVFRQLYLNLGPKDRERFRDAFNVNGRDSFLKWAVTPARSGRLSPFLSQVRRVRPDVAETFPDPQGKDREAFIRWAMTSGAREMGFEPSLVTGEVREQSSVPSGQTTLSTPAIGQRAPRVTDESRSVAGEDKSFGVNVCGYLRNETGLGAAARGYIAALRAAGVPVALRDVSHLSVNRSEDPTISKSDASHPYPVNLFVVNADQHFELLSGVGPEFFKGKHNIGVWAWELPSFPEEWRDRFAYYNEVWVGTSFIANALSPVSPVPVVRVPPALEMQAPGSREDGRRRLGARPNEFVFLFIFDFRSYFQRKNPLAVIEAFKRAFAPEAPVRLEIKCVNEHFDSAAFAKMQQQAHGHNIRIHTGYWSAQEMRDLMGACDAYVSLHRSEGTGLTVSDAMAIGKPVIATGWSGNTDFMNVGNSFPVAYDLVTIEADAGPYKRGSVWADPSVEHASELMRYVVDNPEEALARGQKAKQDIKTGFSAESIGQLIVERLKTISRTGARGAGRWRGRSGMALGRPSASDGTNNGDGSAQRLPTHLNAPYVPPMDLNTSLFGPVGKLGKQIITFLLSYHTYYQRNVNLSFSAFMRELAEAQEGLGDELDGVIERLEAFERSGIPSQDRIAALEKQIAEQRVRSEQLESETVATLKAQIQDLQRALEETRARMDIRPFVASDFLGSMSDLSKPLGYSVEGQPRLDQLPSFSDVFRGPEDLIADRQRPYLDFFRGLSRVVDLGCGRGEFLRLLQGEQIPCTGVDVEQAPVRHCQSLGLNAVKADAVEYLEGLEDGSLDGVFSAQVIEHLDYERLVELLNVAQAKLRPGGVLVAETVNPESFEALKSFHVDPTHQRPIFPQVLLHLCAGAGFGSARIFYPMGGGFTQAEYRTAGEYAVVAYV